MRLWVYKVNTKDAGNRAYGDWEWVFDEHARTGQPVLWGGAWASGKARDQRVFREELAVGDRVLAWQTNRGAAIGLCEVAAIEDDGEELFLDVVERFSNPVKLNALKKTSHPELKTVSAFKQGHVGTIYETSSREAKVILEACRDAQRP